MTPEDLGMYLKENVLEGSKRLLNTVTDQYIDINHANVYDIAKMICSFTQERADHLKLVDPPDEDQEPDYEWMAEVAAGR